MWLNEKTKELPMEGGLYEVFQQALALEARGEKIIHMEIGKPDFDSPEIAKEGVKQALDRSMVHYTAMNGIPELRQAIVEKYEKDHNLKYDYRDEIVITAGASEALASIIMAVINPEDEIIVPSPYFPLYLDQVVLAGGKMVEIPLKMENDFQLKAEDIETSINEKTKLIVLTSPHNPTGSITTKVELEKIAKLAIENNILVVSDETYDQFLFEGVHESIAGISGMRERTIVVNSASKTYSMTGWRIGYAMGPKDLIKYITKVHQGFSTCATSFAQAGAVEAYKHGDDFIGLMLEEFEERKELIYEKLSKIEGIKVLKPKGAFYIFPNISSFGMSDVDFCKYILDEAKVAIVPGSSFGKYGEGFVRICYACSKAEIEEGIDRIEKAIGRL